MRPILIVDDRPEDILIFSRMVKSAGQIFEPVTASSGKDALEVMELQDVHAVLLDLRLAGEDGIDILKNMRASHPDVPVIVLTGFGGEETAISAFLNGAANFLPKDRMDVEVLRAALNRALGQSDAERELQLHRAATDRANRLDAVGQFAAGIAHDFNNYLATIRYAADLLERETTSELASDSYEALSTAVDQSAHLTGRLLAFTRHAEFETETRPVADSFHELETLLATSIQRDVPIAYHVEGSPAVNCDQSQLVNALLNLAINARDAILPSGGGEITISASESQSRPGTVRVAVSDTGPGMPPDVLARCVDPFFTTKANTSGTGIGLAVVQNFTRQAGGELLIDSKLKEGTTIAIVLPAAQFSASERVRDTWRTQTGGGEQILLVEDENQQAEALRNLLAQSGYKLRVAHDGEAALRIAQNMPPPDMLLTDVSMPDIDGFALAQMVRAICPGIGVIYLTGYAEKPKHPHHKLFGPLLQKPVPFTLLVSEIERVLSDLRQPTFLQ